jgi:hypothetical protein
MFERPFEKDLSLDGGTVGESPVSLGAPDPLMGVLVYFPAGVRRVHVVSDKVRCARCCHRLITPVEHLASRHTNTVT